MHEIEKKLRDYLAPSVDGADLTLDNFRRMPEGWSRECFMFTARWTDDDGDRSADLILRKDPAGSLVYTDRIIEAGVIRALDGSGIPVPKVWNLETDDEVLGSPFMVMEKLPGTSSPAVLYAEENAENRRKIGHDFIRHLATLHTADISAIDLPFTGETPTVETAGPLALEKWERTMYEQQLEPQPFLTQATRWLRANLPVAPRVSLLHGDYRTGNFLFDGDRITGVVDWELASLGDPMEDLGWVLKTIWRLDDKICGFFEREEFLSLYEEYSGIELDRDALAVYEAFAEYKHCVYGLTGTRTAVERKTDELNFTIAHLYLPPLMAPQAQAIGI